MDGDAGNIKAASSAGVNRISIDSCVFKFDRARGPSRPTSFIGKKPTVVTAAADCHSVGDTFLLRIRSGVAEPRSGLADCLVRQCLGCLDIADTLAVFVYV